MEYKIIINGFDLSPYLLAGGVSEKPIVRQSREIVTMDGTLHRAEIRKQGWSVQLVTLRDQTYQTIKNKAVSPATVAITKPDGSTDSRTYYVTEPAGSIKTVRGGNTYYSGVSFELEAMQ